MRRRRDRKRRNQRIVAGAVGLAILAAGLVIGASTMNTVPEPGATPTVAPPPLALLRHPGEIAISENDGLYGKDPSTGATRKLGGCSAPCETIPSFAWSPDGTAIAYVVWTCVASSTCSTEDGLWVKQAGQQPRQLPIPDPQAWQWSPDGSSIAFIGYDGDRPYLALVDPIDGSTTMLSSSAAGTLAWSPDGSAIAFADGSGVELVTAAGVVTPMADSLGSVDSIAWSPDGSRLVVDALADRRSRLYVLNVNGLATRHRLSLRTRPPLKDRERRHGRRMGRRSPSWRRRVPAVTTGRSSGW